MKTVAELLYEVMIPINAACVLDYTSRASLAQVNTGGSWFGLKLSAAQTDVHAYTAGSSTMRAHVTML